MYFEQVKEILESNEFKNALERVNDNFPHLKQEHLIRDVILTMYNQWYNSDYKAFSEHPRKWKLSNGGEKRGRVDLSLHKANDLKESYRIELKFNFTKDIKNGYIESIEKEYINKECDLLIIIVQEFLDVVAKKEYDAKWGIDTNLLQYQIGKYSEGKQKSVGNDDNFAVLESQFNEAPAGQHHNKIQIEVQLPYRTKYTFCFLERRKYGRIIKS